MSKVKKLSEVELALFERNSAQRGLIEALVENQFGARRRAIDKQDAELWKRIQKRLKVDLAKYAVDKETGDLKLIEEVKKEAAA